MQAKTRQEFGVRQGAGIVGLMLAVALAAGPAGAVAPDPGSPWDPWFQVGLIGGSDLSRGEAEAFLPWGDDNDVVFLDLRGNVFTDDFEDLEAEGNFMAGWRRMLDAGVNLGLWMGGDVRYLESNNRFWQYSAGIEVLHPDWDFRFNGYVPLTDPKRSKNGSARVQVRGNRIFMTGAQEVPMGGFDGEIGWRIPVEGLGLERDGHDVRIFAGGFYFSDDRVGPNVAGPRGRFEWQLLDVLPGVPGSRLVASAGGQWDDVRGERYEGGLHLRVPFSWGGGVAHSVATASMRQARRMTEPVVRDVDIVVVSSGPEKVRDAITEVRFDRVARARGEDEPEQMEQVEVSKVSLASQYDSITDASAAAGPNSLVIANGYFDGQQTLYGEQTLQGGGSRILVRGEDTGEEFWFTAPGDSATLFHDDNGAVLTLPGSWNHVAGLNIRGGMGLRDQLDDHSGINATSPEFFGAFTQLDIRDLYQDGIRLSGDGFGTRHAIFNKVKIVNVESDGIDYEGDGAGNRIGWLENVRIRDTGDQGVDISGAGNGRREFWFKNVEISDIENTAIEWDGDGKGDRIGHFDDVRIWDAQRGIRIGADSIGNSNNDGDYVGTFKDVWVSDTNDQAISIQGGGDGDRIGWFENVHIEDADEAGIEISGGGDGDRIGHFYDVHVDGAGQAGISISGGGDGDRIGTFEHVSVNDTDDEGIEISGGGGGLRMGTFHDVSVSNTRDHGIAVEGGGDGDRVAHLTDVTITNAGNASGEHGVSVQGGGDGDRVLTMNDVDIDGTGDAGVRLGGSDGEASTADLDGVSIANTGGNGIEMGSQGALSGTFTDVSMSGAIGDGDDALIESEDATNALNGTVDNAANNAPDLCQGDFTGTIQFTGIGATAITDGVGCN